MGDFLQFKKNGVNKYPVTVAIANNIPIGSINLFGGNVAPTGWLFCNGQAVSRTEYSQLFSVIGTTFGAGNGSTTFNLPNYNNRFPVGAGDDYDMGDTGGSANAIVPRHYHAGITAMGNAAWEFSSNTNLGGMHYMAHAILPSIQSATGEATRGGLETNEAGEDATNKNLPPYLAINYIIKAKDVVTLPASAHVIDSLDSTSATDALSANMGRELNEEVKERLKVVTSSVTTPSVSEGDYNVSISLPAGIIGTVKAVIPIGFTPVSTWGSTLMFKQSDTSHIYYRVKGTAAQQYLIYYAIFYAEN